MQLFRGNRKKTQKNQPTKKKKQTPEQLSPRNFYD